MHNLICWHQDDNVEILEHEAYPDPSVTPMPMTPPMMTRT
jgi:hypothetical protein